MKTGNAAVGTRRLFDVRTMVLIGVSAAIIAVFAPWKIPVGPIPITLATFAIYFVSAVLGAYKGTAATAVYILLGAVGVPVFSGFAGGFHVVAGVTGGYIVGYIFCALVTGLFCDKMHHWSKYPIGMVLGTVVLYAFGTAWYCILAKSALVPALAACVFPFIGFDALKIAAASIVAARIKPVLDRML